MPNSRGRDFYFYLAAPLTPGRRAFTTQASTADVHSSGQVLVNDRAWSQAADLVFRPHYGDDPLPPARDAPADGENIPVLLTGGHSVGQTFRAERDNLDGVWLPTNRLEDSGETTRFVFHLASPPLLPYSRLLSDARLIVVFCWPSW